MQMRLNQNLKPRRSQIFLLLCALLAPLSLYLSPSAAAAELKPGMRARIAAIRNEGEGTTITENFLKKGDRRGTETQKSLQNIAASARAYLDASVRAGDWNDTRMGIDGPTCFDAAPKFALMLRALGLPGYVVNNDHHVFLVAETKDATLIIDPTIRQYFGQNYAPTWVPQIFVGTLSELRALYAREPGLPVLPYQQIYFDPSWPSERHDSKMISRRNKFLSSPNSREHEPLTDFFNRQ